MNQVINHEDIMVFDGARAGQEWERRFYLMIELCSPRRGGIGFLSQKTGISERRWKNVMLFKQQPAIEMGLALGWMRPELALWLWTGKTDGPNSAPSQSEIDLIQEARLIKMRRSENPDIPGWLKIDLENWAKQEREKPTEKTDEKFKVWSDH